MKSEELSQPYVSATRCPYCHEAVERGRPAWLCRHCHAVHHRECSLEARACGSCGEWVPRERALVAPPRSATFYVSRKEPWLAVLLTLIAPGLGHVYAGKVGFGVAVFFLAGVVCLALVLALGVLGLLAILALDVWLILDAYASAERANGPAVELRRSAPRRAGLRRRGRLPLR